MTRKKEMIQKYREFSSYSEPSYFIVVVELLNGEKELIINTKAIDEKIAYYETAYNDDLELIANPKIKIVDYLLVKGYM